MANNHDAEGTAMKSTRIKKGDLVKTMSIVMDGYTVKIGDLGLVTEVRVGDNFPIRVMVDTGILVRYRPDELVLINTN